MLMGAAGTPDFQCGFVGLNSMSEHSGNHKYAPIAANRVAIKRTSWVSIDVTS